MTKKKRNSRAEHEANANRNTMLEMKIYRKIPINGTFKADESIQFIIYSQPKVTQLVEYLVF